MIKYFITKGGLKVKFYPLPFTELDNFYKNLELFKYLGENKRIDQTRKDKRPRHSNVNTL